MDVKSKNFFTKTSFIFVNKIGMKRVETLEPFFINDSKCTHAKEWLWASLTYVPHIIGAINDPTRDQPKKVNLLCFCEREIDWYEVMSGSNIIACLPYNKHNKRMYFFKRKQHNRYVGVFNRIEENLDKNYCYVNFFSKENFKFKICENDNFKDIYRLFDDIIFQLNNIATFDTLKAKQVVENITRREHDSVFEGLYV